MDQPVPIGLDLAKSVFEMHGADAEGRVVLRRQLRRSQVLGFFERLGPCLVGMEACSGAHHRARELIGLGREVRLMPPACVKPYVKRGKTDGEGDRGCRAAAQAPERCRGDLRGGDAAQFKLVRANGTNDPVDRSTAQNALRAGDVGRAAGGAARPQRARDFPVRQRPQTVNAIRAPLSEFGIVTAKGIPNLDRLLEAAGNVPGAARPALGLLAGQLRDLEDRIEAATARIAADQKADPLARRLATIPGLGPIASSAFAATTPNRAAFRSARDYAAWLGLTSRAHSSGGKERLGQISKAGNRYLRRLLYLGAMARISARRGWRAAPTDAAPDWLDRMLAQAGEGGGRRAGRPPGPDGLSLGFPLAGSE